MIDQNPDPLFRVCRAVLMRMDPEKAHDLALSALDNNVVKKYISPRYQTQASPVDCLGLHFANPVGLAAGLDKNGDYIDALGALGFGHLEIGTLTPRPQPGNEKPRIFRLREHAALINRLGFNNRGIEHAMKRLEQSTYPGVVGVNIGKNASTPLENALDDYLYCLERAYPLAGYITVNISSPNTRGLRDLQQGDQLEQLLDGLINARENLAGRHAKKVPLLIKLAPDLCDQELENACQNALAYKLDGMIVSNTTTQREWVKGHRHANQTGGLSGRILKPLADRRLAQAATLTQGKLALIGVGGISCAQDTLDKLAAGASLVQLYTGFIYQGPALVRASIRAHAQQP